ncbi:MAG: GAF and ANTAR domain-containing protein [Acidimicrobiales bacterium]
MEDREEWMASTFVELADTLVADFDVIDFLSVLVERCAEFLDSTEVGLALKGAGGDLRVIASSTERMRLLELIEIQNDEGPCRDCALTGEQVLNQRLDHVVGRWPEFAPKARETGFQMVHALPLRLRADVIGAMNIFNVELRELTAMEAKVIQALADVATIGILQQRALAHETSLAGHLQEALNSRVVIEQAKGIVAERLHVEMDEAFALLRGYSRSSRRRLSEVASEIIAGLLSTASLVSGQPDQGRATEAKPSSQAGTN